MAESIYTLVFGRAIQGAGAIGSVVMAQVADSTRVKVRSRAIALVGMSIGMSFGLAMILGPALRSSFGLSGIFYFTGALALIAFGDGPKPLSFAPSRARNIIPEARSCASGPTNGTVCGKSTTVFVNGGLNSGITRFLKFSLFSEYRRVLYLCGRKRKCGNHPLFCQAQAYSLAWMQDDPQSLGQTV